MAIAVAASRQSLADQYKTLGTFIGLATADPGTTATPSNEATGGSYARVATTWTSATGGVVNGSAVTINVAAGTYTFALLGSAISGNNMVDKTAITSTTLAGAGQIIVTPTFTQS